MPISIDEFEWDDGNEAHCLEHGLDVLIAEEVRCGFARLYRYGGQNRTGTHKMIGVDGRGTCWTIILEEKDNGRWRPITGWMSTPTEKARYWRSINKGRKK